MKDVMRRHGLLMAGFALQLSLSLVLLWDPFATVPVERFAVDALGGSDQLIRSLAMPAALALAVILLARERRSWRVPIAAFSIGALFASLGLLLAALAMAATAEILIAFSLTVGIAFGGMFALFFAYLTSVPQQEFVPVVLISSALSGVVTLLAGGPWAFGTLVVLCVALSVLLPLIMRRSGDVFAFQESGIPCNVRGAVGDALRPLTCFGLCALVAGLMRTQSFGDAEGMMFADMVTKILCPVGAMLLAIFSRQLARPSLLERLYDVLFPVTVTLYLLLPLLGPRYGMILTVVDMLVFFLLSPLFVLTSRNVAARYGLRAFVVCGAFACSFYGAAALGSALGAHCSSWILSGGAFLGGGAHCRVAACHGWPPAGARAGRCGSRGDAGSLCGASR